MNKLSAAFVFIVAAAILLWKPLFLENALLPADYLQKMHPWSSTRQKTHSEMQWNPLAWDAIGQFYPWRVFLGRSIRQGTLPLWNPHQFCGTPFLANAQSAVLYPPNWLFALFEPVKTLTFLALFHLALAGFLTYLLLRSDRLSNAASVFGGLVFELSAFMLYWLELPTLVCVAAWMPGVMWASQNAVLKQSHKYGAAAAVMLALTIFAGHLQIAFYVWFLFFFWAVFLLCSRWLTKKSFPAKELRITVVSVILAVMLTSAQSFPSLELQKMSHRNPQATKSGYSHYVKSGLAGYRFVTAALPDYFGNPTKGNYYLLGQAGDRFNMSADYIEFGLYAGVATLPLALTGVLCWRRSRYVRFWTVTVVVSLLLAAGTPLNYPMYFLVPGFSALGGPHRILLIYALSIAVLSAYGVDRISQISREKIILFNREIGKDILVALGGILLTVLAIGVSISQADKITAQLPAQLAAALDNIQTLALLRYGVLVTLAAALLIMGSSKVVGARVFKYALIVLISADLIFYGWQTIPMSERNVVYPQTELTKYLSANNTRRVLPTNKSWSLVNVPKSTLPPNAAMVYGFYDVQGYDSLFTSVYKDFLHELFGVDPCPPENGNMVLGRSDTIHDIGLCLAERDESNASVGMIELDGVVVLDSTGGDAGWIAQYAGKPVSVIFNNANSMSLELPPGNQGSVLLRVLNYPGWKDKGHTIQNEGIWMDVPIESRATINVLFQPESFRVGLFLSLLGVAGCSGFFIFSLLKETNRQLIK